MASIEQSNRLNGKRIAITGATGYVGRFIVPHLLRAGASVRVLARSTSRREGVDERIEWVTGDLLDESALATLVDGADSVVHLAYQHVPGRYRGGEGDDLAAWIDVNLHGSINLLLAARRAGVPQFLFLSSRAVFAHTEPGRVLDEMHPISPDTHYGAYKAAVESMLRGFAAVEGMRTTALRATGVYGVVEPVAQSKWWELVKAVLAGEAVTASRGGTEVHGDDVARTVVALLAQPSRAPDVVHLSDLYVTQRQLVSLIREVAGRPGPLPPPPSEPARNVLICTRLAALGITLGGEALLRATIEELVAACSGRPEGGGGAPPPTPVEHKLRPRGDAERWDGCSTQPFDGLKSCLATSFSWRRAAGRCAASRAGQRPGCSTLRFAHRRVGRSWPL